MELKGTRIQLNDLCYNDIKEFKNWGVHNNTLFSDYNLSELNESELDFWYEYKKRTIRQRYFSIRKKDVLIGYVGMKKINLIRRSSVLGIVLDPNQMDQGYGSEAIRVLLEYYFNIIKMKIIKLNVNAFNLRAIHCYEKIGFKKSHEFIEIFECQDIEVDNKYFEKINGIIYSVNYTMEIRKLDYRKG